MLDNVDLTKKMSKQQFKKLYPQLKERLGELQREITVKRIPVMVVFEGWDPTRTINVVSRFVLPLDPRGFRYHNVRAPTELDKEHPFLWRFWVRIPAKGQIVVFDRSWYSRALAGEQDALDDRLSEVQRFERMLSDDGTVILKFFLHTAPHSKSKQCSGNGACGLTEDDLDIGGREQALPRWEKAMVMTDRPHAPWTIVEAEDDEHSVITVLRHTIHRLEQALEVPPAMPAPMPLLTGRSPRAAADLSLQVKNGVYEDELERLQSEMLKRQAELFEKKRSLAVVFEGRDASGKGGAISRLTTSLNPRTYKVAPIYAPSTLEKAHHYQWRFYRTLPLRGHIVIFDRSWYGRVLVERVDGLATEAEWSRAFREINDFERALIENGTILVKLWLEIDKATQLKRFIDRVDDPKKSWKITADDWRSRAKWDEYSSAVDEMLMRTSTDLAPWTVVEGNDKNYARLKALRTVLDATKGL